VLSGFFSSSETSFFSLKPYTLELYRQSKRFRSRLIARMLRKPNHLLITILLGNMLVNTSSSALATGVVEHFHFSTANGVLIVTGIMTILILIVGEIIPKLIAVNNPKSIAQINILPITIFYWLLYPVKTFLLGITNTVIQFIMPAQKYGYDTNIKKLKTAILLGHESGAIDTDEKELFTNVIQSFSTSVSAIAVPRTKVFAVQDSLPLNTIITLIVNHPYRTVPICKNNIDEIYGVINKIELLPYWHNLKHVKTIRPLIRPVINIPGSNTVNELLAVFQKEHRNFAVVLDEYGGTHGIITLYDLTHEIMGTITEELRSDLPYRRISRRRWLIRGEMSIEKFNRLFNTSLSARNADTIGGMITEHAERFPKVHERFYINSIMFTINTMTQKQIQKITVDF